MKAEDVCNTHAAHLMQVWAGSASGKAHLYNKASGSLTFPPQISTPKYIYISVQKLMGTLNSDQWAPVHTEELTALVYATSMWIGTL